MNKLVFADDSELEIITITGGKQYIQNAMRDVLTIEIEPEKSSIEDLRKIFQDKNKTKKLTSTSNENDTEIINEIGSDYTLYLSVSNEIREVQNDTKNVEPPKTSEINIVKIAQITYLEKLLEQALGGK